MGSQSGSRLLRMDWLYTSSTGTCTYTGNVGISMASRALHFRHGGKFSGGGIFSAFRRGLDGIPRSFAGVFQTHVKKDEDKNSK